MIDFLKKNSASCYFLLCMLVFMFCSFSGNELNTYIDFPHVELGVLPINIIFFITFVFCSGIFFKQTKLDFIVFLLFARLLLHLIPIYYVGVSSHFSVNFLTSILCLLVYIIVLNCNGNFKNYICTINFVFVILCVQIILEFVMGETSYFGNVYFYKHDMTLPVGASNALASKVVPMFALLFVNFKSKAVKLLYALLALVVVCLTKSRGGILDLMLVIIVILAWQGYFSIKSIFKFIISTCLIGFIAAYGILFSEWGSFVFSDSDETVVGRYALFMQGLTLFSEHPFFGNGFYYFDFAQNPHNWVLDVLMRSGLAGFFLVSVILCCIWRNIKNFLNDPVVRGCLIAVLCMLWQGLVEIVLFTHIHDFLMWSILGLMMSRVDYLKNCGMEYV
ncbi:O-antigen ligase [Fibrobacter sp. UWH9]|nr:O-antigen ligase [Fibrobacter sp. UWH9]